MGSGVQFASSSKGTVLRLCKFCLPILLTLLVTAASLTTDTGAATGDISLGGSGGLASPGGLVGYTMTLANWGGSSASTSATMTLPDGFSYKPGFSTTRLDGRVISTAEPIVDGRKLTWPAFDLPGETFVSTSRFGIHTMVQDLCLESYIDFQLDKALALAGEGAYVKQMFYSLKPGTSGPKACWTYFVNGAYNRHLIPIVRLQGEYDGSKGYWVKPQADAGGGYATIAAAYRRVVEGLPRRPGLPLYVEIWNEPELTVSWSNSPSAAEYGRFFVDVAKALHAIGDSRIRVLNGALTPGNAAFAEKLMRVSGFSAAFDLWAAHCYPYNHPPQYNLHSGTARYPEYAIDSYRLELSVLARHGRSDAKVILTETGHGLGDNIFSFEGYPAINETNRANYMVRAFRDFWSKWPELQAACPHELVGPYGDWGWMDWLHPTTDVPHAQYTAVAALPKPALLFKPITATITFRVQAATAPGVYYSTLGATADGVPVPPVTQAAPVRVIDVVSRLVFPLILKSWSEGGASSPKGAVAATGDGSTAGVPVYSILAPLAPPQAGRQPAAGTADFGSRRIPLPGGAGLAVAVDDSGAKAFVSRAGGQLDVISPATGALERTLALPADLDALAYDPAGRLYGTHATSDRLFAIDLATGSTTSTTLPATGPVGLAVDPDKGQIFVASAADDAILVLDRSLRPVARASLAALGDNPLLGLALDPAQGRVYVARPLAPGRHGIVALDETGLNPLATWGGGYEQPLSGLYGLAVQPGRGRLIAADRNVLWWVDPSHGTIERAWHANGIVPRGGIAFTPDGTQLLVLDGDGLWVIATD